MDLDILQGLDTTSRCTLESARDAASAPDLSQYSRILVFMSGKDSLACLLHLFDLKVPKELIEIHHHCVDGMDDEAGPASTLMDWPCTEGYISALGKAFGLPVYFSYRRGGLEKEMNRENCGSEAVVYTRGDGVRVVLPSDRSKPNTRLKFPQVSANLTVRWCSGFGKISVADRMLINDPRFTVGKTLVITGERAEESCNRARYATFEPHRADNRTGKIPRHIDVWRPVHSWDERDVWNIIAKHRCLAHPCYYLSWGRASCKGCIFSSKNAWATLRLIDRDNFDAIAAYERKFGYTIHRSKSVIEQADEGAPYQFEERWLKVALSREFNEPIFMDPWIMPRGAFGESCGPT